MIYINNFKKIVYLLSIIFLVSCSQAQEHSTSITFQDESKINFKDSYIDYINNNDSKYLQLFLEGSRHIKIGTIDKADKIFHELKRSPDKEAKEYGEFGLLLIAYETDNMPNMKQQLQSIDNINSKSEWLKHESNNYNILYNFKMANFKKVEELLSLIKETELTNNPNLASVKSALYARENKINEAIEVLQKLKIENEESIATTANLISLIHGYDSAIDHLLHKKNAYPSNEFLELIYNQFLVYKDKDSAYNNIYKLGLRTKNTYILVYSMELLFPDATNDGVLTKLNMLQNRIDELEVAKNYIDYYLNRIALPINSEEMNRNILIANEFNPMNYRLLWHEYYNSNADNKLDYLHKLEAIDPYDNIILLELAKFYKYKSMDKELVEIKQRFKQSKRIKSEAEIEFMGSL